MAVDKKVTKKADAAPAPAPAASAATPAAKAAKAPKAPKSTPAAAAVVVPTTAAPSAPSVPVVVEASQSSDAILSKLTETLKALSTEFSTKVREAVKATQEAAKQAKKEARDSKKKHKKNPEEMTPEERKVYDARRANNAFLVQRPLTEELCGFMGVAKGTKRSQTEVTKFISEYVKSHNCFDPNFKRRIIPNAALMKLLRVDDKTEVTYLNLQKFLKVHFVKPATA
jgi:chromatin remodeling complex protein RSC6